MGFLNRDDPDYYNNRRENREDMRRAMRENERYGDGTEDIFEFFLLMGIGAVVVIVLGSMGLFFGAEHLDNWFNLGLVQWLDANLPEWAPRPGQEGLPS